MKILMLTLLLLTSCAIASDSIIVDKNKINIKVENTFDEDQEFLKSNHVILTFTKVHKCTANIELPKEYSPETLYKIIAIQRQRCMFKFNPVVKKKRVYNKNPKILTDFIFK